VCWAKLGPLPRAGDDNQCKDFDVSKLEYAPHVTIRLHFAAPSTISHATLSSLPSDCHLSLCCSGTNPKHYCTYQIAQGATPKVGDVSLAKPQDAHPTQAAYGEVDAACVQLGLEAYAEKKDGSLRAYLQSKTVPTIVGPDGDAAPNASISVWWGGRSRECEQESVEARQQPASLCPDMPSCWAGVLYITDHHHLSIALLHAFLPYDVPMTHRLLFMCVSFDMSHLSEDAFWETLKVPFPVGGQGSGIRVQSIGYRV